MSALVLLLIVSIGIAASFLVAYLWSVRDGQFDDDYSPARRILFSDGTVPVEKTPIDPAPTESKTPIIQ